ncbi:hypothetical protein [Paenibacillus sp. ACRRY]|uniref:hypothetical protein n=1 Tax=Paenibacillus sp. ACRRY TaxID=2918208 RepID=UPI001EF4D315|nr:hypothetical protein [Paenibacillus sp. ACRRY]MCG7384102.1 hypothetical protein [Paenibacillus sp. ACRRY]
MNEEKVKDIVYYYARLFEMLKWVSFFRLIVYFVEKKNGGISSKFVELWVFFHCVLSSMTIFAVYYFGEYKWIIYPIIVYGWMRVVEIIIYQINVLLFDPYRATQSNRPYQVKGYLRMIILLIHNAFEIVFWFSSIYMYFLQYFGVEDDVANNIVQAFYISFVTMTSFGLPNFVIKSSWGLGIISVQSFIGLIMTMLTFARFISLLPMVRSGTKSESDDK